MMGRRGGELFLEGIAMLVWNPDEVLACLEVIPEVGEHDVYHVYTVERHGIRLRLTVCQYEGDIYISLYRIGIENPLFDGKLINCAGCRYVNDKRGEYLEFAPARCFGDRYDRISPIPYGVRLAVKPSISITLF
jgi:hypothetical protein